MPLSLRHLGHLLWLGTVLLAGTSAMLSVLNGPNEIPILGVSAMSVAFAAVGALVAQRQPANAMGWLLGWLGLAISVTGLSASYSVYAIDTRPGVLPAGELANWVAMWFWTLAVVPGGTFLLLLFPDGHLRSRRWRPVAWLAAANLVAAPVCFAIVAAGFDLSSFDPEFDGMADLVLVGVPAAVFAGLTVASAVSSRIRYQRAQGDERQQLKWFGFSTAVAAAAIMVQFIPSGGRSDPRLATLVVLATGIPVAIGLAIFKYRLYDIDVVIRKTFVYASLAGFITAVYLAVVVGIGAAIGSRGGAGLPLVATAIAALGFNGVRGRARRLANRLVYGVRATPYETLSRLSERLTAAYSIDEFLPALTRVLAEATGARRTEVWVRTGTELRCAAAHGDQARLGTSAAMPTGDTVAEIRSRGELLGAITLTKPPSDPLTARDTALVRDLAAQAAIAIRDVMLTAGLRESRQRIVRAQDGERRRLERDIHDGAQQNLVALGLKLQLTRQLVGTDAERARVLLDELADDAELALETVRDLARGVFPAILADKGLGPALRAHLARIPVPVEAELEPITGRLEPGIEAAVYFCCLEALQNAAKHAAGATVRLAVSSDKGWLRFTVSDSGPGFDQDATAEGSGLRNMADRLEALGGRLRISSAPGRGTTVEGRVPG